MLEGFQDSFRDEAYELLNSLEQSLLELEERPDDHEVISAVFRSMHTIKGSAAMFGFEPISAFAHRVESTLDDVRGGKLPVTSALVDFVLACRDHIRALLDSPDDPSLGDVSKKLLHRMDTVVAEIRAANSPKNVYDQEISLRGIGGDGGPSPAQVARVPAAVEEGGSNTPRTFHVRFRPKPDMFRYGTNPLLLVTELRSLGDCTILPDVSRIPALDAFDPEELYVGWDVFLTTTAGAAAIQDVFMFVTDQCELVLRLVDEVVLDDDGDQKRLGQILIDRGVVAADVIDQAVHEQRRLGEVLVGHGVAAREIDTALKEQEHARRARQKLQADSAGNTLRVPSEKLDELVDLVGELVTLQARLTQTMAGFAGTVEGAEAVMLAENFERLIGSLRDHTMSIRMVPMSTTFGRFKRLVRDLSQELGKEIELLTEGGETELDKTVIDRLHDPLVHIIRNSIDHGIESPQRRRESGKPSFGTLYLEARHAGGNVVVVIRDDGAGLNRDRIRARAIERGIIAADANLTDREVDDLIFQPGFSTAEKVTAVSGRGVGMDVVRRELESIGGTSAVQSDPGRGTTVTLTIPLTLAIIDGLLVRIGNERFVIPLNSVEECIEFTDAADATQRDRLINNRGELLPVVDLRTEFHISGQRPAFQQVVVVQSGIGSVGVVVDAVIGDHQTVIKNLGRLYQHIEGVSGATILGDGDVALILDIQRLIAGRVNAARIA